jgi:hypothetical protein
MEKTLVGSKFGAALQFLTNKPGPILSVVVQYFQTTFSYRMAGQLDGLTVSRYNSVVGMRH